MKVEINGKLIGVYQDHGGFFARFQPESEISEVQVPITSQDFHGLVFRDATLTLELK
jgi:hypothetical protein